MANDKKSGSLSSLSMNEEVEEPPLLAVQESIRFRQLIESKKDEKLTVAIFMHKFPDADSIASATSIQWLLTRLYHIESSIFFDGKVSHPQNNVIDNVLEPKMIPVSEFKPEDFNFHVLLDTVPKNAGAGDHKINFDIVIDHHKDDPNGFGGLYINLHAGSACATVFAIIENCCKDTDIWFEHDNDYDKKVATAILCGVQGDTDFLTSDDTTEYEFNAFSKLFEYRNPTAFKEIVFYKKPKLWVKTKCESFANASFEVDGIVIIGIGIISEHNRDLIAEVSSEAISWAGSSLSICFALISNKIEGSVRSSDSSVNVSELCKRLGKCGLGVGNNGGGKKNKGAYSYSLSGFEIDDEDQEIQNETWNLINKKEKKRIMKIIKNK